jgi:hypothetical protein
MLALCTSANIFLDVRQILSPLLLLPFLYSYYPFYSIIRNKFRQAPKLNLTQIGVTVVSVLFFA